MESACLVNAHCGGCIMIVVQLGKLADQEERVDTRRLHGTKAYCHYAFDGECVCTRAKEVFS